MGLVQKEPTPPARPPSKAFAIGLRVAAALLGESESGKEKYEREEGMR